MYARLARIWVDYRPQAMIAVAAALLVPALPASSSAVESENRDRVALVIGNSRYDYLPSLENPYNDAQGMAAALWQAGFETIELIDADREEMVAAIATFAKRIQKGSDAVFFYAGHGVQINGANYLLPVSTRVEDVNDLNNQVVDANEIVGLMGNSEARINVVILDACRDNPFVVSQSSLAQQIAQLDPALIQGSANTDVIVRSTGGLAPMSTGRVETVVGYSTAPGTVALDGLEGNSPYTSALLEHINTPGLEIGTMFRRVRATVREATDGFQIPWTASTLESEFYFRPALEDDSTSLEEAMTRQDDDTRQLGLAPPRRLVEDAFWQVVTASGDATDLRAYLARYPDGVYVDQARENLDTLETKGALPARVVDEEATQIAYLGIGPVQLRFPAEITRSTDILGYQVTKVPTSGSFFRPDETRIHESQLVSKDELEGLRFLPQVGTKNVGLEEQLVLQPLGSGPERSIAVSVESQIHPCDLLAGFRHAPDRVWDGVQQAILNLDPEPAISACEQAVADFPDVVRFAALLARTYRSDQRYEEALHWATNAADRDYPPGISQLGTLLMRGNGTEPDYERAMALFRQAYAAGNPASALRIGELYEAGLGVQQDYAEAAEWYRNGIALGNAYAGTRLARLYEDGRGFDRDMTRAVEYYRGAAAAGELTAQIRLARIFMAGAGVEQNPDEALELFLAVAGTGMPEGQKALGQFYEEYPGSEPRLEQAVYWYEKADANGDPWAPLYLSKLYLENDELNADESQIVALLTRAVERNNNSAARVLAKLYETNQLGAPDPALALRYHQLAAEGGNVWSMRDIANALWRGDGVVPDPAAGLEWMTLAADGGNPWAQRDLGIVFAQGQMVARDPVAAARYLGLAIQSGDQGAAGSARERLETLLSSEERTRATQEWLNDLGYDVGVPDGRAGPRTRSAIGQIGFTRGFTAEAADSPELIARLASMVTRPARVEFDPND